MAGPVSIYDVQGLIDPLKGYQFQMIISPIRGVSTISSGVMSLRCTATELPGINLEQVRVDLAGFTVVYPGRVTFSHVWRCTLVEGQDATIRTSIASWMKLTYNWITGTGSNKPDIQSTAQIQLYENPGDKSICNFLYGLFPIGNPAIQMAMGDSRAMMPDIVWSFDYTDIDQIAQQGTQAA